MPPPSLPAQGHETAAAPERNARRQPPAAQPQPPAEQPVYALVLSDLLRWPFLLLAAFIAGLVWLSGLHSRELAARREAYLAALDLAAALEPGVTYVQYRDLLVRVHQGFRRGEFKSPRRAQSPFWTELRLAVDQYDAAADTWREKIEADASLDNLVAGDQASQRSHQLEAALQAHWAKAAEHLRNAAALMGKW